ncbi:polyprotein, partial [cosavirus A4]
MGANNSKESVSSNGNEGTIVNNFYSNQYYASIDASAQGVGTSTTPENGNVSGFLGLAGSAFNALSLLASPIVEGATYLEDRLLTRRAGNTAVNSQAAEGVLLAYGKESDKTCPTSCGDEPSEGTAATDRSFVIQLQPWVKTNQAYTAQWVRLTQELRQDHKGNVFAKNLKSHAFAKLGFEVTVQVNTSPFHCGMLGLFLVPEFTRPGPVNLEWKDLTEKSVIINNTDIYKPQTYAGDRAFDTEGSFDMGDFTPEQFMLFPHQLINPKDNNIATVRVPYINIAPTNDPTVHTVWTAVVMVLVPLNFSEGASPTVSITMTITPIGSVFNGLHHAAAQGPIPVRPFHNFNQFSTTVPLRTEPCYGMTVTPPLDYMPLPIDDLMSLVQVPSFVSVDFSEGSTKGFPYFAVNNATQGKKLFEAGVVLSDPHYQHTLLSNLARFFCNYRGSIQFDFVACT